MFTIVHINLNSMKISYVFFLLMMVINSCVNGQVQKWVVTGYKTGTAISEFDDNHASKYIGKSILISKDQIIMFGDTCNKPFIKVEKMSSFDLLNTEYGEKDFSIIPKDSVIIRRVRCSSEPIYQNPDSLNFNYNLIEISEIELIVSVGGIYFVLHKE